MGVVECTALDIDTRQTTDALRQNRSMRTQPPPANVLNSRMQMPKQKRMRRVLQQKQNVRHDASE